MTDAFNGPDEHPPATTPRPDISIREFLRTGELGPIRLGDDINSLRRTLGEPHDFSPLGIWKYGDIEFHFRDAPQRLWLIFCDAYDRLSLGSAACLDAWFFDGHPTGEVVEQELSAAQIRFRRQDLPYEPSGYVLCLESGVELVFNAGDCVDHEPRAVVLAGFQYLDNRSA